MPGASALLEAAVAAARRAAEVIRRHSTPEARARLEWREKSATDFVTRVDTAAEEAIADALLAAHPDAALVGEELSPNVLDAALGTRLAFVVDPLDGTTNFLHGFPWYAVSIAAITNGRLAAGVVLNVCTRETFTATAGGGAHRDGAPMRVSRIAEPSRALVGTGFPFREIHELERYQRHFAAVARHTAGMRRAGSAALDLADVACGRFDAFWELSLAPWDVAAGILLVREAGGIVTDDRGRDAPVAFGPIVAGNPSMHRWMLDVVNSGS